MDNQTIPLNSRVARLLDSLDGNLATYRIAKYVLTSGATIYDFGVQTVGSLQAGILLSRICLAELGHVELNPPNYAICEFPIVQVSTDHAWLACMGSQYAGWSVKTDNFFAMGSGPMRVKRGKERILEELELYDSSNVVVGVLETEQIPNDDVVNFIAAECGVQPQQVILCVAPTTSIAGSMQIVARSIETALHKIHTLGGNVKSVETAIGWAPLPPPAKKFMAALGRTNDAILYAGHVALWSKDEGQLVSLLEQIPSSSSKDFGKPFAEIFAAYGHDFYKIDGHLFAPAMVTIQDQKSGQSRSAGKLAEQLQFK